MAAINPGKRARVTMVLIRFRKWELESDPQSTRDAYAIVSGGAESCSANDCQNFAAARLHAYPPEALDLFQRLGIDFRKEAETFHNMRVSLAMVKIWREQGRPAPDSLVGLHHHGGWFHFVGRVVKGPDCFTPIEGGGGWSVQLEPLTDSFSLGFSGTHAALVRRPFKGKPIVQVEFEAMVPWILEKPEPM